MSNEEHVKWFTGGVERGEVVTEKIAELIQLLDPEKGKPLRELLFDFHQEIKNGHQSIPFILSRMDIAVAKCLVDNGIVLTEDSSQLLKQILSMGQIRYGY